MSSAGSPAEVDEADVVGYQQIHHRRVTVEQQCDIRADRTVGEVVHPLQVGSALIRGRLDNAQGAGVGHRRGELGTGDVGRRRLNDRDVDLRELAYAVGCGATAGAGIHQPRGSITSRKPAAG
jgi:hypothetical protein